MKIFCKIYSAAQLILSVEVADPEIRDSTFTDRAIKTEFSQRETVQFPWLL